MEKNTKNLFKLEANFHIHSFIIEMGLSANETLIYAFLYSFTKGKCGVYYGTHKYLANTLNIATRTVERIIKKLREKGLIEKYKSEDGQISGIRAVVPKKKEKESVLPKTKNLPKTSLEIEETLPDIEEKYAPVEIPGIETLSISRAQYEKLRELVPSDVLYGYARRFDRYMYKRLEGMLPSPRSHYKVLKAWIEEDLGT